MAESSPYLPWLIRLRMGYGADVFNLVQSYNSILSVSTYSSFDSSNNPLNAVCLAPSSHVDNRFTEIALNHDFISSNDAIWGLGRPVRPLSCSVMYYIKYTEVA